MSYSYNSDDIKEPPIKSISYYIQEPSYIQEPHVSEPRVSEPYIPHPDIDLLIINYKHHDGSTPFFFSIKRVSTIFY